MTHKTTTPRRLRLKVQQLTARLEEAQQTLHAIHSGDVDALVIAGAQGDQVFTLNGADKPYRVLVEQMQEGAATIGLDHTILYCNRRLAQMLGRELESVMGTRLTRYLPVGQCAQFEQLLGQADAGRGHGELDLLTPAGLPLSVTVSAAAMPLADVRGWALVISDVSEQKARTQELQRNREQLRTLATLLIQAEQSERRRLAQVLHDNLQQLLVAANFRLCALLQQAGHPADAAIVQDAKDLLHQAIQASRSLTCDLNPPVIYSGGLGPAIQWLAKWEEKNHGLKVEFEWDESPDRLSDDLRGFLFQSARELLLNVVKHAGTDRVKVSLREDADKRLRMVVADEGRGLDADADRRVALAEGFGVSSLRARLLLLGGQVTIESSPGHGTKVTLLAPQSREAPAPPRLGQRFEPATVPASPAPGAGRATGGTPVIRIALADDHKIFREGLARLLRSQQDFEVVGEARDGQSAVELALQLQPDVVIMDVSMPLLSGIEATRIITGRLPRTRVIGLSMHEEDAVTNAMQDAGVCAFVTKDAASDRLVQAIRGVAAARVQ